MAKYPFSITLNRSKPAYIRKIEPEVDTNIDYLIQVKNCGEEIYDGFYSNKRNNGTTYVFIYNVEGSCSLKTGDDTKIMEEGQFFIINLKEFSLLKQVSPIWHNYWLCLYGSFVDVIFSSIKNHIGLSIKKFDAAEFKSLINYIIGHYEEHNYDCNDISLRIYQFLISLYQYKKTNNLSEEIQEIIKYLESEYENKISIDALAKSFNFSKYYLIKKFKKETGFCPIDYLNNIRIKRAKILLENTNMGNEEIAARCGFFDVRNLYYLFKKKTGVSPMVYRAEHQISF